MVDGGTVRCLPRGQRGSGELFGVEIEDTSRTAVAG